MVYKVECPKCSDTYIGETIRKLETRVSDHRKQVGDLTAVLAREEHMWKRKIRETIEIRTQRPTLNRNTGYNLPAIFDNLLSQKVVVTGETNSQGC